MENESCFSKLDFRLQQSELDSALLFFQERLSEFVDIPQKIDYFQYPSEVAKIIRKSSNLVLLPHIVQALIMKPMTNSTIHIDVNQFNQFDKIIVPRKSVLSFAIFPKHSQEYAPTEFYDDIGSKIAIANYEDNEGILLNVGGKRHGVKNIFNSYRMTIQFCFDVNYQEVLSIYKSGKLFRKI